MDDKGQHPSQMVESVAVNSGGLFAEDEVHWWKQPGLRRLYLLMPFLFLGSTTLGYDGSLLNGLQAMPTWQDCTSPMVSNLALVDCSSLPQPYWLPSRLVWGNAWIWRSRGAPFCPLHC